MAGAPCGTVSLTRVGLANRPEVCCQPLTRRGPQETHTRTQNTEGTCLAEAHSAVCAGSVVCEACGVVVHKLPWMASWTGDSSASRADCTCHPLTDAPVHVARTHSTGRQGLVLTTLLRLPEELVTKACVYCVTVAEGRSCSARTLRLPGQLGYQNQCCEQWLRASFRPERLLQCVGPLLGETLPLALGGVGNDGRLNHAPSALEYSGTVAHPTPPRDDLANLSWAQPTPHKARAAGMHGLYEAQGVVG